MWGTKKSNLPIGDLHPPIVNIRWCSLVCPAQTQSTLRNCSLLIAELESQILTIGGLVERESLWMGSLSGRTDWRLERRLDRGLDVWTDDDDAGGGILVQAYGRRCQTLKITNSWVNKPSCDKQRVYRSSINRSANNGPSERRFKTGKPSTGSFWTAEI